MAKSLGIFVTTTECLSHVIGITKAAKAKGSNVKVFFTWKATNLSKDLLFLVFVILLMMYPFV